MERRDFLKLGAGAAIGAALPSSEVQGLTVAGVDPIARVLDLDEFFDRYRMHICVSPIITKTSSFSEICKRPPWKGLSAAEIDSYLSVNS